MEQKDSKIFKKETMQAVSAFCESVKIDDIDNFIYLCFKQGFDIKKYGFLGETGIVGEKQVEIEVIREIRVEVPVEVIREVEKIVYKTDDSQINELLLKIQQLETKMSKKDKELDELRHNLDIILDKPPVEIVKEVEIIKEVEVPNDKMGMLQETLQVLRKELQTKNERIKELEKINRDLENINTPQQGATYLRGSNLNNRI
jgi:DNA repair exonuclease SbcCD ATPase subunit